MKSLALAVLVVAGSAFAQEIGTEITPTTPNSGVQQNNPPPPPQEPKSGYVYKPKGAKDEGGSATASAAPGFTGNKVSASSGDFGIRAGFSSSINLNTGSSSSTAALAGLLSGPGVGIAYFASDPFKLLVDLQFGMLISGSSLLMSVGTVIGFDYLFRTPADALRPFVHFAGTFNLLSFGSALLVNFGAQVGFGAEYFFNPAFSVNGRMMLSVPMAASNSFVIAFIVVPAIGATWYL